jgi:3-oxoacyl-ACP reductase-like protein
MIAAEQAAAAMTPTFNAAAFRRGEEASMASFAPAVKTDYDERFRFSGMDLRSPTMETAASSGFKGLQGSSGNTEINLTVNGNIQTENDIIQAIRTGLLAAQQNGQGLTLQAI